MMSLSSTRLFKRQVTTRATEGGRQTTSGRRTVSGKTAKRTVSAQSDAAQEFYGPNRRLYLPDYDPPAYLDGTMAGDHGYDPLGIGGDPKLLEQFRRGEVINGRFAMLGVVGMIIPEILDANGTSIKGANWLTSGKEMLNGGTLDYLGVHIPFDLTQVLIINSLLVFTAEFFRVWGQFPDGTVPDDELYPGFDPLGLADDPAQFEIRKVNEVRNGRLAMMGFLGFAVQGYVTGEGPWANLTKHIADPNGYNILTELGK